MQDQINEIEITIEEARQAVANRDALRRLMRNADFKRLFLEQYLKDEPARLVGCLEDPQMQHQREHIEKTLSAISILRQHIQFVEVMGNNAEASIEENEALADELRAEAEAADEDGTEYGEVQE